MGYLFTSESVSEGHPDKIADQISDALLDEFLRRDSEAKVACETLVTTGLVVLSGEVKTKAYVDVQEVARRVIKRIGYTNDQYRFDSESCGVISTIHEQSPDITRGVVRQSEEEQGAGDQGMMFGYACRETDDYMPLALVLSHVLLMELAGIRREGRQMTYLRPDAKSQVTLEYDDNNQSVRIHTIVVSTQHDEFDTDDARMLSRIYEDVKNILIPRAKKRFPERVQKLFKDDYILHVNPTGKFVIGGPHGDTGLTGRKIIVDTYGGKGAHGGGAFSGKDSSKVDRSGAYAARHIAKNMVAAGIADEVLIQVAYAIGVARPINLYVNTYGTAKVSLSDGEIAQKILTIFDLRPAAIVKRLGLKNPIFEETAAYGHFGRDHYIRNVDFIENSNCNGEKIVKREVEFFTWEKLDYVDRLKSEFGIK
ncbi:MAG TPA: methionine adenosyltransferase [Tenuifilaceae bacterium]|nr:methionine adenosyltransferase [Tenuifilaceae bacterium]